MNMSSLSAPPTSGSDADDTSRQLVLEVKGLTAGYGRIESLHGIDLTLSRGQLVALVGANGAGKTTLLRAISGLIATRAGSVSLFGQDVTNDSPDRRVRNGLAQVNREQEFTENYMKNDSTAFSYTGDFLLPRDGCPGPYEVRVQDNLLLIFLNSQWFLTPPEFRPANAFCGIANDADIYAQVEDIIARNQEKFTSG